MVGFLFALVMTLSGHPVSPMDGGGGGPSSLTSAPKTLPANATFRHRTCIMDDAGGGPISS